MPPAAPISPAATPGPLAAYRALVREGAIDADPVQALATEKLQALANALRHHRPNGGGTSWRERLGLARRFVTLIDALYEMKTKLVASVAAEPDALCTDPRVPEFRRAASRLHEMQSPEYLDAPHRERG